MISAVAVQQNSTQPSYAWNDLGGGGASALDATLGMRAVNVDDAGAGRDQGACLHFCVCVRTTRTLFQHSTIRSNIHTGIRRDSLAYTDYT